jgi:arginase
MRVQMIQVPYDSAHRGARMGGGPAYLLPAIMERCGELGCDAAVEQVETDTAFPMEVSTSFELNRLLSGRVRDAVLEGRFPLVLAGNCNTAVGTLGGVGARQVGVVWFDSHADFNTPETTPTGFLDGMGLAIATGRCWRRVAERVPGFSPVEGSRVLLVGTRESGPGTFARLREAGITLVGVEGVRAAGSAAALPPALVGLRGRVEEVYLHLDLDVLDPEQARANAYAEPDGLSVDELVEAVGQVRRHFSLAAAAITCCDPDCDRDGAVLAAAGRLTEALLGPVPPG